MAATIPGAGITTPLTLTEDGNLDTLIIRSTDADASAGPVIVLDRASGSPADDDLVGRIIFRARDDGGNAIDLVKTNCFLTDASDGSEDATFEIDKRIAGTYRSFLSMTPSEIVLNDDSVDLDFRVESNGNANMLMVNGAGDRVGIGADPDLGAGLHIKVADSGVSAVNSAADELVLENSASCGLSIFSGTSEVGKICFGDSGDNNRAEILYNHSTDHMTITHEGDESIVMGGGRLQTGEETSGDVSAGGLCLNQKANDTNILTFKSSDVAHGITSYAETDTFAEILKLNGSEGGFYLNTFSESIHAFHVQGNATSSNTATSSSANGPFFFSALKKSGTAGAAFAANDNVFVVANDTASFIIKGDGEIHSNQTATVGVFDTYDDAQLVRAYDLSQGKYEAGLINSKFDKFVQYNSQDLVDANLIGQDEDGTPNSFVNVTGFQRLHNGAIWQQYEKHQQLAEAVYEMAKEALGADKANAILKKHDIKLLN